MAYRVFSGLIVLLETNIFFVYEVLTEYNPNKRKFCPLPSIFIFYCN